MITWNTETLPDSRTHDEECNPYYLVKPVGYGPIKAMFIDGEWWTSYVSKIVVEVTGWAEL